VDSLCKTILTEVKPDDVDYAIAKEQAISGRFLLDIKRTGKYKARGVKQGFKEDKSTADGPIFGEASVEEFTDTADELYVSPTVDVSSADNLADIFTKILDPEIFQRIRDRIMHRRILLV
jgi:hypothetical protein